MVPKSFLEMIDRLYGCKIWKAHRLEEPLIKLIIDCRNLDKASVFQINKSIGYNLAFIR